MGLLAKTLMLTTECSAGCSQCPFSSPVMMKRHLPLEKVKRVFADSSDALVVVSGGEPFEYLEIHSFLEDLESGVVPLRIATGGHIDLESFLPKLKKIHSLQGISLGTDVLTLRVSSDRRLDAVWLKNVYLLQEEGIPISITVTTGDDLVDLKALAEFLKRHKVRPQFFYIRFHANFKNSVQQLFRTYHPDVPQIVDELVNS
ncbi:MAG: radical SAM protein [Bacillota bacterium]